ncbi:coiled-coil domain-containing protein 112-like isoform X2 [Convolutriloba macropyga]|uniref:coiled-coil domain-containing protein 112-like isoform X2 n=1 Tax=Convolutriloba macropyga TaxID=536237 RepID=UPI003F521859
MRPAVKVEQKASSNDEKVKLLKEISQLQQKIKALERERNNTVFSKKSEMRPFYSDLEESNIKIEEERKNEALKMRRDLDKLKSNVSAFRNTVLELKPGAGTPAHGDASSARAGSAIGGGQITPSSTTSVERLKEKVEEIDSNINLFKSAHRENYEKFVLSEKTLSQEISALDRRIDVWDLPQTDTKNALNANSTSATSTSSRVKIYNIANDLSSTKPPEVIEYEKYVEQHGGLKGGWEEYDHVTFTKYYSLLYKQQNNHSTSSNEDVYKRKVIERLAVELAHRSLEDIEQHFDWFRKMQELGDKKKYAITQWRKHKDQEREVAMKNKANELDLEDLEGGCSGTGGGPKGIEVDENDLRKAEEKRELLKAWKEHKEDERRMAKEIEAAREKEEKEKERQQLARQKEVKAQIDEMKRKKSREDEIERLKQLADELEREHLRKAELREKRIQSTKKALAHAEEKKEHKKLQEFALAEKAKYVQIRKKAVEANVTRDPNRLLQPTQGWAKRVRENEESQNADKSSLNGALAVSRIQHRATPSWRSNVS